MYGTVAVCQLKPGQSERLREVLMEQQQAPMAGWLGSDLVFPDNHDDQAVLVVRFEDRASYEANASSPGQHERYLQLRELLESDPVWYDGEWTRAGSG